MGDELADFKTIRLCSITAALSNRIAVAITKDFPPRHCRNFAGRAVQMGTADAHVGGKCMR
jgi:hypothetical protein